MGRCHQLEAITCTESTLSLLTQQMIPTVSSHTTQKCPWHKSGTIHPKEAVHQIAIEQERFSTMLLALASQGFLTNLLRNKTSTTERSSSSSKTHISWKSRDI